MKCLKRLKTTMLCIAIAMGGKSINAMIELAALGIEQAVEDSKKPSAGTLYITNNNRNGFTAHIKYNQRSQEQSVYVAPGQTKSVEIRGTGHIAVDGIFYNFSDNPSRQFGSYGNCPLVTATQGTSETKCHVDMFGSMIEG